ncbi:hypothetical protein FXF51_51005 [Nonomuraea sp. PA05]|uniref:hypothetical protein n=1 Tax=Nonomuraea sp. PA05 TaxID=2604466 RepID=UPI0011D3D064|nr:hypothetical protein [Nonomuraea sp. PA05]TYB52799.1 hypothetical protein FXF51_51005 [Nonomuraea sp. PA05]
MGVEELLTALGPLIEGYEWRLSIDWLIGEIEGSGGGWLPTDEVVRLFAARPQLVDGEVEGRRGGCAPSDVQLRASDSTSWDVRTARADVAARIGELFPDAVELTTW